MYFTVTDKEFLELPLGLVCHPCQWYHHGSVFQFRFLQWLEQWNHQYALWSLRWPGQHSYRDPWLWRHRRLLRLPRNYWFILGLTIVVIFLTFGGRGKEIWTPPHSEEILLISSALLAVKFLWYCSGTTTSFSSIEANSATFLSRIAFAFFTPASVPKMVIISCLSSFAPKIIHHYQTLQIIYRLKGTNLGQRFYIRYYL